VNSFPLNSGRETFSVSQKRTVQKGKPVNQKEIIFHLALLQELLVIQKLLL
jgi:hypothetical protein